LARKNHQAESPRSVVRDAISFPNVPKKFFTSGALHENNRATSGDTPMAELKETLLRARSTMIEDALGAAMLFGLLAAFLHLTF
jgi:hypothetical protein